LAAVKPRAEYERIVTSGLFGSAGKAAQEKPAAAPAPVEEETKLRLKLCGTSATKPRDLFASAIILNEEKNQTGTYCVGQEVVDKVTLEEVWQRKVILLNKGANRREVLRSEPDTKEGAGGGAGPTTPQPKLTTGAGGNRVTLKKQEIVQDLVTNYADIVTQIKPELYHDAEGKVAGLTASNLESIPIAQKLGVKNGDVLQTVNNEVIDSEEKIMELVNKYRNSSTFRIGLLRDGKPLVEYEASGFRSVASRMAVRPVPDTRYPKPEEGGLRSEQEHRDGRAADRLGGIALWDDLVLGGPGFLAGSAGCHGQSGER
jgi:type II secretory pathway component PulC